MEGLPEQIERADAPDMEEGHVLEAAGQRRYLRVPSDTYEWSA